MNERDFAREMRRARQDRRTRPNPDNDRRLELIAKMEANEGTLEKDEMRELRSLQRKCGLFFALPEPVKGMKPLSKREWAELALLLTVGLLAFACAMTSIPVSAS